MVCSPQDVMPPFEREMWEAVAAHLSPKVAAYLLCAPPGELQANLLSRELGCPVDVSDITLELALTYVGLKEAWARREPLAKEAGMVARGAEKARGLASRVWQNPAGKALAVGSAAAVPLGGAAIYAGNHAADRIERAGMVAGGANFLGATLGGAVGSRLG